MAAAETDGHLDLGPVLRAADQRLVRAVDGLPDADWAGASLLPGWTRADLVAHLALHAEASAGCLDGVLSDQPVAMYPSEAARDAAIADLGRASPVELRERLMGATTRVSTALAQVAQLVVEEPDGEALLRVELERTPGGRRFPVGSVAATRVREVEIHHVDLDLGHRTADWDPWLPGHVVEAMAARAGVGPLVVAPTDDPRRWTLTGGPDSDPGAVPVEVSGPLHAIAWWLTGRPGGPELRASGGALPLLPAW